MPAGLLHVASYAASCYCFKHKTMNHFNKRLQQIIQLLQMDAPRTCKQEATRLLTLESKATAFKDTAD